MYDIEIKFCIYFLQYVIGVVKMSKLSTKARNALPKSDFAGPDRSYPVQDHSHAANAKARASQAYNKGHISLEMEHRIDAKANKVLEK